MELSLLILVCIHKLYIVYLEIYVVPIGHGFSFFWTWKINVEKEGAPCIYPLTWICHYFTLSSSTTSPKTCKYILENTWKGSLSIQEMLWSFYSCVRMGTRWQFPSFVNTSLKGQGLAAGHVFVHFFLLCECRIVGWESGREISQSPKVVPEKACGGPCLTHITVENVKLRCVWRKTRRLWQAVVSTSTDKFRLSCASTPCRLRSLGPCGFKVESQDPISVLVGCRKRQLNQAWSCPVLFECFLCTRAILSVFFGFIVLCILSLSCSA